MADSTFYELYVKCVQLKYLAGKYHIQQIQQNNEDLYQ